MRTSIYLKSIKLSVLLFLFVFYESLQSMQQQIKQPEEQALQKASQDPSEMLPPKQEKPDKRKAVADTIDFPEEKIGSQGNWIKKKEWLKEALKTNEEIQKIVALIQNAKKPYSEKAHQIDGELDTFYKKEGFEQGKLKEIFAGVEKYLDKKKQKELERAKTAGESQGVTDDLEIKIKLIEKDLENNKKELEQLKLDMQSIGDLDKSIQDRLQKVDEQITVARGEATRSEKLTDETWYIIDDKKARNNYYELKGNILEKLKSIQKYLETDLSNDFEAVLANIRNQTAKVTEEIKKLEEKQFIIKDRAQRVEKIKREELEGLRAEKAIAEKKAKEDAAAKLSIQPWYSKIYNFFINLIAKAYVFITSFFGETKTSPEIKIQPIKPAKMPAVPANTSQEVPKQEPPMPHESTNTQESVTPKEP
jgi:hypothetical protein